ncbi:MAG: DUF4411 family protein [Cytophagales bacterium]
MNAILDTSSLLAFVRYYLPFDKNGNLKTLIETKFQNGEILILDKVINEAKYIAQGIILKELDFFNDKKKIISTNNLLPNAKFYNLLENQFCNKEILRLKGISEVEFDLEKAKFLNTPDANLILYSLSMKSNAPIIVTEETQTGNDNKIFKKIPENCKAINLECCTLPILFKNHFNLDIRLVP